jgi:hypothetical protein
MAVGNFDELELLSQEDLIVEALRKLLRAYAELRRREEVTRNFLKGLCSHSVETRVWWFLFEAGGAQRFTDILRVAGCSRTKLNDILTELLKSGHVKMVGKLYQAISPPWLVHFLD